VSVSLYELALYAGGMFLLWAVPGPVWVALIARALSGGYASAWPLAIGVALGDLVWPLAAIFGLTWVLSVYGDLIGLLRWVAAAMFVGIGALLLARPGGALGAESRFTRPGAWAGFLTGLAAVIGNPKAILFYMGVLPGFFNLTRVNGADIAAILAVSALVPMAGNLALALFLDRTRRLLASPQALRRLNIVSGALLVGVGAAIPFL
jgi:threonine/homoserine/homoserine lactone efflux protein